MGRIFVYCVQNWHFSPSSKKIAVNTQVLQLVMPETLPLIILSPWLTIAMLHPNAGSLPLEQRVNPDHWDLSSPGVASVCILWLN